MQASGSQPVRKSGGMNWMVVGCGVIALLLICCVLVAGLAYFSGAVQPLLAMLGLAGKAQAAAFAPAGSPFFMAVDLDLQQAANFKKVWSVYEKSAQTQTSLNDFKKQFQDSTGCDFDRDVATWWGPDAAIFLTDASNLDTLSRSPTAPPNFVVALGARDQAKAAAALQKCSKDKPTSEETYQGNKISVYDSGSATAVVQNYVLLAGSTDAMHAAIDASSGGGSASLAQSANFKNVVARLPASRVATFYVDVYPLVMAYSQSQSGIQPQTFSQLEAYQAMGGSMAFTEDGLRIDMAMALNKDKLPECTKQLMQQPANVNQALKAVPSNSYALASGSNLKGVWDCTLSQMDPTAKKQMQDALASVKQQMGVDLDADLMSWLTGEYALAVTPGKPLYPGQPGLGVLLLIEAKDQGLVNSKMGKITSALAKQGLVLKDQKVKGISMKVGTLGAPGDPNAPGFGYGFLDSFLVIGGPLDALSSAVDASKSSLADDSTFKAVQAVLPAKNSGYVYVSVSGIEKLISGSLSGKDRATYQKDMQPWLKPVKAIGLASESGRTDVTVASMFVYIRGD